MATSALLDRRGRHSGEIQGWSINGGVRLGHPIKFSRVFFNDPGGIEQRSYLVEGLQPAGVFRAVF